MRVTPRDVDSPGGRPQPASTGIRPLHVDVVYDTVCPWCYIGKRRLEAAMARRPRLPVSVRWWPFLLNPGMPSEGVPRATYLAHKFGGPQRARRICEVIADAGRAVGIDFRFDRIARMPCSADSHRLVMFAAERGRGSEALDALFRAFFTEGRDIGARDELLRIGAAVGLDAAALARDLAGEAGIGAVYDSNSRAHLFGVEGVPAYVVDGRFVVSGAQDPDILVRVLDVAAADRA